MGGVRNRNETRYLVVADVAMDCPRPLDRQGSREKSSMGEEDAGFELRSESY